MTADPNRKVFDTLNNMTGAEAGYLRCYADLLTANAKYSASTTLGNTRDLLEAVEKLQLSLVALQQKTVELKSVLRTRLDQYMS